jgi:type 1 glutamine amidotransferase
VTRIVILSGLRGIDDPWHDFEETSRAVASCLCDAGWHCTVAVTAEAARAGLADADLLIVNSGLRSRPGPDGLVPAPLLDYLASSRAVLGLHAAANTFRDVPEWAQRLGVRWVEGVSMHPPIGWQRLLPAPGTPVLKGLDEVVVHDELYTNLDVLHPATVLLAHRLGGLDHPLVLAREVGPQRTVYDALGHGVQSYRSASRQELLRSEVRWLLGDG